MERAREEQRGWKERAQPFARLLQQQGKYTGTSSEEASLFGPVCQLAEGL